MNTERTRTFEDALVRQCAPTLAGMKSGSIFCVKPPTPEFMRQKVRQWDKQLKPSGLSVQILLERPDSGSMIVYVYRRKQLERILEGEDYRAFLAQIGYVQMDLDSLLAQLALRLETQPEFPHEIGVFLGYPLQDVVGFIKNHGRNYTCCGFWKSYSDPAEVQACFGCYRQCVHHYMALFKQGTTLEELAVSA